MSMIVDYYKMLKPWNSKLPWSKTKAKFMATKFAEITCILLNKGDIEFKGLEEDILSEHFDLHNGVPSENPKVVVVVPVFVKHQDHLNKLHNLAKSLYHQSYQNIEFLFVDDCSPIHYVTPDFIQRLSLTENKGPATARNKGIEKALEMGADIIAFTDSDCVVHSEWAATIATTLTKDQYVHALSGNTLSYNQCWLGHYHNINGTLNGRKLRYSDHLLYGPTCNFAYTRALAAEIKFNTEFPTPAGEDLEFCFRILKEGLNIVFIKDMIIYHDYGYTGKLRNDFPIFWKQFARYGKGEKKLLELMPYYYDYLGPTEAVSSLEHTSDPTPQPL